MNEAPDWQAVLASACRDSSQAAVARRLGVSGSLVNQVLKGAYKGDMARIEELVRAVLMGKTVECPVLGEIPRQRCLKEQSRPFAATNPQRVTLYRACRSGCPHSRIVITHININSKELKE